MKNTIKITLIIVAMFFITLTSFAAEIKLTGEYVVLPDTFIEQYKFSKMTLAEKCNVKIFVNQWYQTVEDKSDTKKIYGASGIISDMAVYNIKKLKMSDVLKGEGNCQAFSLLFREMMIKCGIKTEVVANFDAKHMYTSVYMNGEMTAHDVTAWNVD